MATPEPLASARQCRQRTRPLRQLQVSSGTTQRLLVLENLMEKMNPHNFHTYIDSGRVYVVSRTSGATWILQYIKLIEGPPLRLAPAARASYPTDHQSARL